MSVQGRLVTFRLPQYGPSPVNRGGRGEAAPHGKSRTLAHAFPEQGAREGSPASAPKAELVRSALSTLIVAAYRLPRVKGICLKVIGRLEGGDFYSATLREILKQNYGVEAGAYSYGEGLIPGAFPAGVTIGRYVSIAPGVRIFLRNHPMERLSLHPFFYNRRLGFLREDSIATGRLEIGHDAWLGERAIITPGCAKIGIGAVVGAGAVVTRDVPDFAIVAGNPARLLRYRFDEKTRQLVLASRWWEHPVEEVAKHLPEMLRPLGDKPWLHPLLARAAA